MFNRFSTCWFRRNDALEISLINSALLSGERFFVLVCRLSVAPMIAAIGVLNSWDREFSKVLYSFTVLAFTSFNLAAFSICFILKVRTAFMRAITKYMSNKMRSSAEPTLKVNFGGMKKKSQIIALASAERNTGRISNVIASNETVTNNIKATTL